MLKLLQHEDILCPRDREDTRHRRRQVTIRHGQESLRSEQRANRNGPRDRCGDGASNAYGIRGINHKDLRRV